FLVMLRLQVFDYHRYIFVDEGVQSKNNVKIQGRLHTVNPIAFIVGRETFRHNFDKDNLLFLPIMRILNHY
ncbi:MAG: phosphatidylserine decarboxylase, partial [Candidatus Phytoplasma australasiaticum]|nr:phosphatidylserine decarboxylase [Candidatus Phytoplasma australasiaticum]